MPLPRLPFSVLTSSRQLVSGNHINGVNQLLTGTTTNIVATPAGTAANSAQLSSAFNEITTVASANDSVTLPPARSGLRVCVTNSGAGNSLRVYSNGTDTVSGAANVAVAQNATSMLICIKDGVWKATALT